MFCPASALTDRPVSKAVRNTCKAKNNNNNKKKKISRTFHRSSALLLSESTICCLNLFSLGWGPIRACCLPHPGVICMTQLGLLASESRRSQDRWKRGRKKKNQRCLSVWVGALDPFLSALSRKWKSPNETPLLYTILAEMITILMIYRS